MQLNTKNKVGTVLLYCLMTLAAAVFLLPIVWVVISSFKPASELFAWPPTMFPVSPTLENYTIAFSKGEFGRFFVNSFFVTVVATVLTLLINVMSGYAFAKYEFKGRGFLFGMVLATMLIPLEVIMIPIFKVIVAFNLYNNLWGVIIPAIATPTGVFLIRQYYDKRQYEVATALWEKAANLKPEFPTVWRNLALAYFNKQNNPEKAQQAMEKAFALDSSDARIFLELDQLYKKRGVTPEKRLAMFEANQETFENRDDLWVEHITLLNLLGRHQEAYDRIMSHKFHPWEGGEGKITAQYTLSLQAMAGEKLAAGHAQEAKELLEQALVFPENLGEGKLAGAKDNDIFYNLGCAYEALGDMENASLNWKKATIGNQEPAGMMFYYDQPADMILYQGLAWRKLGNEKQALGCFHKLVDFGEQHIFDHVKIDYFAVSLPDLQLFDEDLNLRNKAHCNYLIALGSYGLGEKERTASSCMMTLEMDCVHVGAVRHRRLFGC